MLPTDQNLKSRSLRDDKQKKFARSANTGPLGTWAPGLWLPT